MPGEYLPSAFARVALRNVERAYPRRLDQPWRAVMEEILDAANRFEQTVAGVRQGPLHERLGELGTRLGTAVKEVWRIASAGHALSGGRRRIDTDRIVAELHAAETSPHTSRSEQTIASIRAQLSSAERLDRTIADTYDRLRATLHNCARFGPRSQSELPLAELRAQLRGRVEWCAVNPARATKLRALFDAIDWS